MAIPYVETRVGGWPFELENRIALAATAQPLTYGADAATREYESITTIDPRSWLKIENQGNQGACQGHALSSGVEFLHVRSHGDVIQLSRAGAYYETQRLDGLDRRGDVGSTIEGGVRLARETGICLESQWPYPDRYNNRRPSGYPFDPQYKIAGHSPIRTAAEGWEHIALHGPIHIGISWTSAIDRAVSRDDGLMKTFPVGAGGGHALEYVGLMAEDFNGSTLPSGYGDGPWFLLANSWSKSWGAEGYSLWSPQAFEQAINSRWAVFVGLFGIEPTTPLVIT